MFTCSGIRIVIRGNARVHWTEERGFGKRRRTVHFTGEETYFADTQLLLGNGTYVFMKMDICTNVLA